MPVGLVVWLVAIALLSGGLAATVRHYTRCKPLAILVGGLTIPLLILAAAIHARAMDRGPLGGLPVLIAGASFIPMVTMCLFASAIAVRLMRD